MVCNHLASFAARSMKLSNSCAFATLLHVLSATSAAKLQRSAVSGSPALSCRGQGSGFEVRFTALPECRTGCENCFQIKICNTSLRVSLSLAVSVTHPLSLFPSLSVCLLCLLLPPPPDVVANAVPLRFARPKLFPLIAAIMRSSRSRYLPLPRSLSCLWSPSISCLLSWALAEPQPDRATLLHSILRFDRAKITWGEGRIEEREGEKERASKVWE